MASGSLEYNDKLKYQDKQLFLEMKKHQDTGVWTNTLGTGSYDRRLKDLGGKKEAEEMRDVLFPKGKGHDQRRKEFDERIKKIYG